MNRSLAETIPDKGATYLKVHWLLESEEDPPVFFHEIADRWTTRVVELYDTGILRFAQHFGDSGGAALPDQPWTEENLGSEFDPEFHVIPITRKHFERVWRAATEART